MDIYASSFNFNQVVPSYRSVEAITASPAIPLRSGVTILAFSSYPNGFPVLDLDDKTAKKMVAKALPSISVEEKRLLFGRTKWEGRTVGAVVYPISEQDVRQVQNIMNDSRLSNYERNMKINDYMPIVMAKDTGRTRIFDIQRNKLLGIQEAEDLAKVGHVALVDANKQAEKITQIDGAASTQAVKEKEVLEKTTSNEGGHHHPLALLKRQLVQSAQTHFFENPPSTTMITQASFLPTLPPAFALNGLANLWKPSITSPTESLPKPTPVVEPLPVTVTVPKPVVQAPTNSVPVPITIPPISIITTSITNTPLLPTSRVLEEANKQGSVTSQPASTSIPIDFYAVPAF